MHRRPRNGHRLSGNHRVLRSMGLHDPNRNRGVQAPERRRIKPRDPNATLQQSRSNCSGLAGPGWGEIRFLRLQTDGKCFQDWPISGSEAEGPESLVLKLMSMMITLVGHEDAQMADCNHSSRCTMAAYENDGERMPRRTFSINRNGLRCRNASWESRACGDSS